jgi:hypothetical protein
MTTPTPAIRGVKARAVVTPITRPVKNAFGIIERGRGGEIFGVIRLRQTRDRFAAAQ